MLMLKILWFVFKWCFIIGAPIFLIILVAVARDTYNKHCVVKANKKVYMTFNEFVKLYPVSADKWYYLCDVSSSSRLNSKELLITDENQFNFRLYFLTSDKDRYWLSGSCLLTQVIFKSYRDFHKYLNWLGKRDKAIKNNKTFEQQKRDLESMDEILRIIQADINKAKEESAKQIEKGAKGTIEVAKRMDNDSIYDLFYKNDEGHWEGEKS